MVTIIQSTIQHGSEFTHTLRDFLYQFSRNNACKCHQLQPSCATEKREENNPISFKSTVMNESNAKETRYGTNAECERDGIRIVRKTEIETQIIPSSREGFPRVTCVRSFLELFASISNVGVGRELRCTSVEHGGFFIVCCDSGVGTHIHTFLSVWVLTSPATCWSIVINCLHDIPIVETFVALLPLRKLCFHKSLEFICLWDYQWMRHLITLLRRQSQFIWGKYNLLVLEVVVIVKLLWLV